MIRAAFAAPRAVVVLDELDRAHHATQEAFLQASDKGYFPLMDGRKIDFRGVALLSTSNIGTQQVIGEIFDEHRIGFGLPSLSQERIKEEEKRDDLVYRRVMQEVEDPAKNHFHPAFLSRLGGEKGYGGVSSSEAYRMEARASSYAQKRGA